MLTELSPEEYGRQPVVRLAEVAVADDYLTQRLGLHLRPDEDDLGPLSWVAVRLDNGDDYVLSKYDLSTGGIDVWGLPGSDLSLLISELRVAADQFHLTEAAPGRP